MRCIYRAENIIDANLVKNALAQAGIRSHVAGEYLTGAAGQLPVFGLVSVLVADADEAAAAPVVAAIDAALRDPRTPAAADDDPAWASA